MGLLVKVGWREGVAGRMGRLTDGGFMQNLYISLNKYLLNKL
jgi:hypothetical protein